ncbi:MAG: SPOR domain-containing protein [Leptospiraceae bacterium]|nr:SPOR domain-containing protein [Leptospiraceae bacterium]MDW8305828.1 SPOR domain-containing protein [Leptospiraceae bacterium]
MRKVYVIHLDRSRIFLLSGIFLLVLSLALFVGYTFASREPNSFEKEIPIVSEKTQSLSRAASPQDMVLPSVDQPLVQEEAKPQEINLHLEDPFITPPPSRQRQSEKKIDQSITKYTIQVGAFLHEKDALKLKTKLLEQGFAARVERGRLYWFVRVGSATSKEKLQTLAEKLRKSQFEVLIRQVS